MIYFYWRIVRFLWSVVMDIAWKLTVDEAKYFLQNVGANRPYLECKILFEKFLKLTEEQTGSPLLSQPASASSTPVSTG
jgi:hypothetical protein